MKKILCICLSPAIQRTINFKNLTLGKVNRSKNYRQDASGKAINSARVLNQLEKDCAFAICPVGKKNLPLFSELAKKDNLNIKTFLIPGCTRECWTLLDNFAGSTTELVISEPVLQNEADSKNSENINSEFLKLTEQNILQADAVLLAGSRPQIWQKNLYAKIALIAKQNNKLFLADFIGEDLKNVIKTAIPDIIKINDEEFIETFANGSNLFQNNITESELKEMICQKSADLKNIIIITRGIKSTYAALNGKFYECPAEKVVAINTTACGDSFNAGFLYEYLHSNDLTNALKKGTWCAARNAEHECPGTIF